MLYSILYFFFIEGHWFVSLNCYVLPSKNIVVTYLLIYTHITLFFRPSINPQAMPNDRQHIFRCGPVSFVQICFILKARDIPKSNETVIPVFKFCV